MKRTLFIEEENNQVLYQFKRDDPNDETVYYTNQQGRKVRLLENSILQYIDILELFISSVPNQNPSEMKSSLIKLIEDYAKAKVEEARDDWCEND